MTVQELMDVLEGLPPDSEVRFAGQPNWPFEYSISDIAVSGEGDIDKEYDDDLPDEPIVYLVEGHQIGYLPRAISCQIGWR